MATAQSRDLNDRAGHNVLYAKKSLADVPDNPADYRLWYEHKYLRPMHEGGIERGVVRRMALERMIASVGPGAEVLETGCGIGFLSIYLAIRGLNMTGVDISDVAVARSRELAEHVGVDNVRFRAENLAEMGVPDESFDALYGHAALHHFVKYPGIPEEFARVLKPGKAVWFSDGFCENPVYKLFHDKAKMERLGDVILTKRLIDDTFSEHFDITYEPFDWFLMGTKLQLRLLPSSLHGPVRRMARLHLALDERMPNNRASLALAGSVIVTLRRLETPTRA